MDSFQQMQLEHQFYMAYVLYCQQNGLNAQDQSIYIQYCLFIWNKMNNNNNFNFTAFNNENVTVTFTTTGGYRVIITASKNMTFEDLFINYANKVGVPHDAIEAKIVFLHNGGKLDPKSKDPISTLFKQSMANITVFDQENIIGVK